MSVPRGTTPTFYCTFKEDWIDLTKAKNVYVTFEAPGFSLTKTGDALILEEKAISVLLSQAETLRFLDDTVEIQANWTMPDGTRISSEIVYFPIDRQLLRKVIE